MKKILAVMTAMICILAAMTSTAFAGQWRADNSGWWYDNGDGTWQNNGWFRDTDGTYYYFNADGYMLADTMTPDGYYVNSSGAWVPGAKAAASIPDGVYIGTLSGHTGDYYGISNVSLVGNELHIYGDLRYIYGESYENGIDLGTGETVFPLNGETQYLGQISSDPVEYKNISQAAFLRTMQSFNGLGLTIKVRNGFVTEMYFVS